MGTVHVNTTLTVPLRQAFVALLKTRKKPGKIYQPGSGDFLSHIIEYADHFTIALSGDFLYSRKILQYMRDSILIQNYLSPSKPTL